ncbi:MAG: oligosaccharide flippase family protein [Rhizobacter sp.]|nr:oligosaccharide flippase family protein [Rhizobacter sp.]
MIAQLLRFGGNLLLARLLMPEAFGLMAVVATMMVALNLLSDIGSGVVIVQSPRGADEEFLHTAWTLQVMRGTALWLIAGLASLGILFGQAQTWFMAGTVYADPRLPGLLTAATFAMVIDGFGSINAKLAERNLEMHRIAIMDVATRVVALTVMVVCAYLTESIWSLVAGALVGSALRCFLGHRFLSGPSPRFRLEPTALRELVSKGKWVIVSSTLGFVAMNGDRMLLGGLIDTTTLGLYSIALGLTSIASGTVLAVLGRVLFPVFSEVVNKRRHELPIVYRKFQQLTDLVVGGLAGFIFFGSEPIVQILYDSRYQAAAHICAILAIGTIGTRFLVVEQIYLAVGRTELLTAATLPRVLVILLGLPIGYHFAGLDGALAAIALSSFVNWPLAIWFRAKHGLNNILNDVVLPVAIGIGLALGYALTRIVAWA